MDGKRNLTEADFWDKSVSSLKDPIFDPPAPWHFAARGVSILMIVAAVRSGNTTQEQAAF